MGRVLTPAGATATATGTAAVSDVKDLKTSWPEVVGWEMLNASIKITSDRPGVSTPFYSDTTPLPPDYDPNRVIIICDNYSGVVVRIPVVG